MRLRDSEKPHMTESFQKYDLVKPLQANAGLQIRDHLLAGR